MRSPAVCGARSSNTRRSGAPVRSIDGKRTPFASMNHSTLSLATHRPTACRSTSVMRAVEGRRSSTLASRTAASVRSCARASAALARKVGTPSRPLCVRAASRDTCFAPTTTTSSTRATSARATTEQRRGARDRDQRGARADRILDAERGPPAAGLAALRAPGRECSARAPARVLEGPVDEAREQVAELDPGGARRLRAAGCSRSSRGWCSPRAWPSGRRTT